MSLLGDIFGLFGAGDQHDAELQQLELQKQEYAQQLKLEQQQVALAQQLARQGIATRTDAAGNTTYYDNATNSWRTILSFPQQRLQNQSDKEQLAQLGVDSTAARQQRATAAGERSQDISTADALHRNENDLLAGKHSANGSYIASELANARRGAISEAQKEVSSSLGTGALRSGGAGLQGIGSALGAARAKALAELMGNPTLEGKQLADQTNSDKSGDLAKLYDLFASRGANIKDAPFNPSSAATGATAQQGQAAGQGLDALSGSATAVANAARGLALAPKPDFALPTSFWGNIGQSVDNLGGDIGKILSQFGAGF